MSQGDRSAIFAVGLVSGIAIAFSFFVWTFPWFSDPTQSAGYCKPDDRHRTEQYQNPDDPHFWVRPFYGWIYAEDTLAQWLMAGFSVLAVGASFWAVVLVRNTLEETREGTKAAILASTTAGKEFELGRRPWVSISRIELTTPVTVEPQNLRAHFSVRLRVKNCGTTPARHVWPEFRCFDVGIGGYNDGDAIRELIQSVEARQPILGIILFPEQEEWLHFQVVSDIRHITGGEWKRPRAPHIVGFLNYYTTYDAKPRQTGFNFVVVYTGGKVALIPDDGDVFPPDQFDVSRSAVGQFAT